jgi:hypothetical protein
MSANDFRRSRKDSWLQGAYVEGCPATPGLGGVDDFDSKVEERSRTVVLVLESRLPVRYAVFIMRDRLDGQSAEE